MIYCLNFVKKNMEVFSNRHPHVREIPLLLSKYVSWMQDHPRMCGKYSYKCISNSGMVGSPPHVREILFQQECQIHQLGITPACAGNTASRKRLSKSSKGSPPHVREIPKFLQLTSATIQDHPRMCGKYFFSSIIF